MTLARAALAVAAASLLGALPPRPEHPDRGHRVTTCDANDMRFDDRPVLRGQDKLDLPGGELSIDAPENGGVRLQRAEGKGFHVLACKAVADGTLEALAAIIVGMEKGRLV